MDWTLPVSSSQPNSWQVLWMSSDAAQVHTELQADDGCSGRFLLPSNPGDFKKGHSAMFTLDRVPCMGRLRSLTVCADGMFPSWRLRWVHRLSVRGWPALWLRSMLLTNLHCLECAWSCVRLIEAVQNLSCSIIPTLCSDCCLALRVRLIFPAGAAAVGMLPCGR